MRDKIVDRSFLILTQVRFNLPADTWYTQSQKATTSLWGRVCRNISHAVIVVFVNKLLNMEKFQVSDS